MPALNWNSVAPNDDNDGVREWSRPYTILALMMRLFCPTAQKNKTDTTILQKPCYVKTVLRRTRFMHQQHRDSGLMMGKIVLM